jgi:hypothetical protein
LAFFFPQSIMGESLMSHAIRRFALALVLLLYVFQIRALALSNPQLATLAAHIAADSAFDVQPHDTTGAQVVANTLNLPASPEYWVWKTRLSREELMAQISPDATSFSWTIFIARSQGERDAFREIFVTDDSGRPYCNPSLPNVRAGFTDIFSGAGGATQRTHLLAISRRLASRVEKLFASGAGTTAAPSVLVYEGPLSPQDVILAWTL